MDKETLDRQRLGKHIRRIREELQLTQQELADLAAVSRSYISQIEGSEKSVSFAVINRIAGALGVSVAELAGPVPPEDEINYGTRQFDNILFRSLEQIRGLPILIIGSVPADGLRWAGWADYGTVFVTPDEISGAIEPFAVVVSGTCLQAIGILSNDIVILDRPKGRSPQHRQIVLVRVGDEITLKRWHETEGGVELRDANESIVASLDDSTNEAVEIMGLYVTFRPNAPR